MRQVRLLVLNALCNGMDSIETVSQLKPYIQNIMVDSLLMILSRTMIMILILRLYSFILLIISSAFAII